MYIVSLTYHRPIAEVDSHLDGHIARLKTYFQDGTFIASGRKNPRTGGVIPPRALTVRGWTPSPPKILQRRGSLRGHRL